MRRCEIRFSGFGGQGIILAGYISGKAASIYDGRKATLIQSYGPEARGGACSAEVIISDEDIDYPHTTNPDVCVVMSQEAYSKYAGSVSPNGTLIIDADLVKESAPTSAKKTYKIPATRIAEKLGRKMVANVVMLGFFTAVTDVISPEAMKESIKTSVPRGTEELNLKAFEEGFEYGRKLSKDEGES